MAAAAAAAAPVAGGGNARARKFVVSALPAINGTLPILALRDSNLRTTLHDIQTGWAGVVQAAVRRVDAFDDDTGAGGFVNVFTVCLATLQRARASLRPAAAAACAHQWWPHVRTIVANAHLLAQSMGPTPGFFDALAIDLDDTGASSSGNGGERTPLLPWQIATCEARIVAKWLGRLLEFLQSRAADQQLLLPQLTLFPLSQQQQQPPLPAPPFTPDELLRLLGEGRMHTCLLEEALSRTVSCDEMGASASSKPASSRRSECDDVVALVLANLMAVSSVSPQPPAQQAAHTCSEEEDATAADLCSRTLQAVSIAVSRLQIFCAGIVLARRSGLAVATEGAEEARATRLSEGDAEVLRLYVGPEPGDVATAVTRWADAFRQTVAACLTDADDQDAPASYRGERQSVLRNLRKYVLSHCGALGMRTSAAAVVADLAAAAAEIRLLPNEAESISAILLYVLDLIDQQRQQQPPQPQPQAEPPYFGPGVAAQAFIAAGRSRAAVDADAFLSVAVGLSHVLLTQASMVAQALEFPEPGLGAVAAAIAARLPLQLRITINQPPPLSSMWDGAVAERALDLLAMTGLQASTTAVRTALRTAGAFQFQTDGRDNLRNVGSFAAFLQAVGKIKQSGAAEDTACSILYLATQLLAATPAAAAAANTLRQLVESAMPATATAAGWEEMVGMAEASTTRIVAQTGETLDQAWIALLPTFADATNRRLRQAYSAILHVLIAAARSGGRRKEQEARLLVDTALAGAARKVLAVCATASASNTSSSTVRSLLAQFPEGSMQFFGYRIAELVPESVRSQLRGDTSPGFQPSLADDSLPMGCLLPLICNRNADSMDAVSAVYETAVDSIFQACPVGPGDEQEPAVYAAWLTLALVEMTCILTVRAGGTTGNSESPLLWRALTLIYGADRLPAATELATIDEALLALISHTARCQVSCRPFIGPIVDAYLTRRLMDAIAAVDGA